MAIQITERQHFVPRTYLKHFAEKKGSGHYNIKAISINDLRIETLIDRNTKSICYEKNLYTQPGSTPEEKMLLETFYSEALEDRYEHMYEMLIDPNKKELTNEERELVIATVATMYYRVPVWIKKHTELMERVFELAIQATEYTGQETTEIEGDSYLIKGKTVSELIDEYIANNKSHQVITQLKVAIGLIRTRLENDNIYIFKLEDGESEFITSDNPVIMQNPKGEEINSFDPDNIIKLPLDSKHYLMLMPNKDKDALNRIQRTNATGGFSKREELLSNTEQLRGADEFILGIEASLKRFFITKDQDVPLTEEEQKFQDALLELGKKKGWI